MIVEKPNGVILYPKNHSNQILAHQLEVFSLQKEIEMSHNLIWLLLNEPKSPKIITKGVKRKEILLSESMVKYAKKKYPPCSHNHNYGINMENPIPNFLNFHYEAMVQSIKFMVNFT
jgi:hypothetical protein